ncbi:MAG: hypothetical protein IJ247_07210 [Bacilli bacterium]|nr:hypothetical protein [Bacilli bacterium]
MGIYIVKGDITEREVDAIGCSANSNLKLGGWESRNHTWWSFLCLYTKDGMIIYT